MKMTSSGTMWIQPLSLCNSAAMDGGEVRRSHERHWVVEVVVVREGGGGLRREGKTPSRGSRERASS